MFKKTYVIYILKKNNAGELLFEISAAKSGVYVLPGLCSLPEKLFQALGQPENLQFDPQLFVACDYLEKFSVLSLLFL